MGATQDRGHPRPSEGVELADFDQQHHNDRSKCGCIGVGEFCTGPGEHLAEL
jgi:hypothetical protein